MKATKTARGFERIEFRDMCGSECSLQQSSIATTEAVWLGCEHETIHPTTGEKCGARMHLDKTQVSALIHILTNWLETGSLQK